ncbi:right-handed parallel beta-helix repeat-containing protein [Candidatus Gracilibacteria bacterium]|nr:right-handed parallel beta-helix repeat-containing protein [Candidatus Gracilibacteria bacterium]NJM87681.1 right-handed parallel beta-helix repeat-containing protein [Hydrococcus sp. RU_2_2]NJP19387.1 right-handed parallel beta-helix repeat-containing protein [Hydrococcus sp. CRU_1_1]
MLKPSNKPFVKLSGEGIRRGNRERETDARAPQAVRIFEGNRNNVHLSFPLFPKKFFSSLTYLIALGLTLCLDGVGQAQEKSIPQLKIIVNSDRDGSIQPDSALTLREAILLANGTLSPERLSEAERALVEESQNVSRIEFDLLPGQTTISVLEELPPLAREGLIVDGTTQPGYDPTPLAPSNLPIPMPIVAIAPANDKEILRGLTIVADNVTVKGLSIYGFASRHGRTATTPPADIFIAHRLPPPDTSQQQPPDWNFSFRERDIPPQGVAIEANWLGILPDGSAPVMASAFGVSVFNSRGTTIRHNWIAHHDGSGIITSVRSQNLIIEENLLENNGFEGMPDAIRLEGIIDKTQVIGNEIHDNAGSAIYLFKPEGATQIRDNRIARNGKRFERAAIFLMGNGHELKNNKIQEQPGPGVVVAAYPQSRGNRIQDNQFSRLDGLSIDLVGQIDVSPQAYQKGDGVNPPHDSYQRRRKTGNFSIEAPRWLSPELIISPVDGTVELAGVAEPNSQVDIYRVTEEGGTHGPLNQRFKTVKTDDKGNFSLIVEVLKTGDRVSAIATHPEYGTSEPAENLLIRAIDRTDK